MCRPNICGYYSYSHLNNSLIWPSFVQSFAKEMKMIINKRQLNPIHLNMPTHFPLRKVTILGHMNSYQSLPNLDELPK